MDQACGPGSASYLPKLPEVLQRGVAPLFITNSNRVVDLADKNFAVADFSRARSGDDGMNGFLDKIVRDHQFELDLGYQIDGVFSAAIKFRVPFLAAVATSFEHRHALDADFVERVLHGIQLRRLNNRFQLGHRDPRLLVLPRVLVRVPIRTAPGAVA